MSAKNLISYLSLRTDDIRSLQDNLFIAGLSSLQSSESHILRQLQAIQKRLGKNYTDNDLSKCDYETARELMQQRSTQLFGIKNDQTAPYLMVTFDADFIDDVKVVSKLLEAGMNVARINCAHDDHDVWEKMILLVRKASEKTGLACSIYMDLAGPKMRTSLLGKGRKLGKAYLMEGQEIILAEEDADYDPSSTVIGCNEAGIIKQLKVDDRVLFDDGLIEAQVKSNSNGLATIRIIRMSSKKPRLKDAKGINFPDSELIVPAITDRDRSLIPFICRHADLVGYSFVRDADGIQELQQLLAENLRRPHIMPADALGSTTSLIVSN